MLLLSQGGQAQKWYNQYGNVSCNTVCQLFNQPKTKQKNLKVYKQSCTLSSSHGNFIHISSCMYLSHARPLNIQKLLPRPSGRAHLA